MIEKVLYDYMKERCSVPVFIKVSEKPKEYVTIRKNGENGDIHTRNAMVTMRMHGTSEYRAAVICEEVQNLMFHAPEFIPVLGKVELNSAGDNSDVSIRDYEYMAIFDIVFSRLEE